MPIITCLASVCCSCTCSIITDKYITIYGRLGLLSVVHKSYQVIYNVFVFRYVACNHKGYKAWTTVHRLHAKKATVGHHQTALREKKAKPDPTKGV